MDYKILYQVKFFDFSIMTYIILCINIMLIGVMIYTRNRTMKFKTKKSLFISILITSLVVIISIVDQYTVVSELENGDYMVVKGEVKNFVSGKSNQNGTESFWVNDIRFYYSHSVETGSYNKDNSVGGSMHEGMMVRISYNGNHILKIEAK